MIVLTSDNKLGELSLLVRHIRWQHDLILFVNEMVEVPDRDEFNRLIQRVDILEEENAFSRSVLLGLRWLSRLQTLKVLDMCGKTLWRMAKDDRLKPHREGNRDVYAIDEVRALLLKKNFTKTVAESRIISALYTDDPTRRRDRTKC